jgi:hypothetical protein
LRGNLDTAFNTAIPFLGGYPRNFGIEQKQGRRKQLIQTTFFWRTGELARTHFRSQNEKKMLL